MFGMLFHQHKVFRLSSEGEKLSLLKTVSKFSLECMCASSVRKGCNGVNTAGMVCTALNSEVATASL